MISSGVAVTRRRRVDWPIILGPKVPIPHVLERAAGGNLTALLAAFDVLLDKGRTNLLDAALASGFGSYAQFHRVFRAQRRMTPREYLQGRG